MLLVLAGPSGVGKGSIVSALLAADPTLRVSRSWTTRPRRASDADDAYVFTDVEAFRAHAERNGFLEWAEVFGNLYGTPVPDEAATNLVLEIDVQGAALVKQARPDAVVVFVEVPDRDEQRRRLEGRGEAADVIERRLAEADREEAAGRALADHCVVNHDLAEAVAQVQAIVRGARHRTRSQGSL